MVTVNSSYVTQMKVLEILVSLVAIANARPSGSHQPSGGYLPASSSDKSKEQEETHVYFYGSQNDVSHTHLRINVIPTSKKNTKVIFVKAPHHGGVIPEVVAPPSKIEDKTLVYVLLKKPSDGQSISIPANIGIKQAKPQVFFIKYNKKQEAESLVNSGVRGQHVGTNVPELPNEQAFADALGNGEDKGYQYGPQSSASLDSNSGNTGTIDDLENILIGDNEVSELPSEVFANSNGDQKTEVVIGDAEEEVTPHTSVVLTDDNGEDDDNGVSTIVDLGADDVPAV